MVGACQDITDQKIAEEILMNRAREEAVFSERSRLARELHAAVTQTLFSTTLTAEVLPRIWERSPEEGLKKLQELRELTRGALAEMRTLLMELRPDALADDGIGFEIGPPSKADHYGLGIMRERAEKIGASFLINSKPGHGTCIQMRWQAGDNNNGTINRVEG